MRSSEAQGGGLSATLPELRRYLEAAAVAVVGLVAATVAFTVLMDPMEEFGFAGTHPLNAFTPQAVQGYRVTGLDRYLGSIAEQDEAWVYLVGSSRVEFGFDTCGYDGLRKVVVFGLEAGQTRYAQNALLSGATTRKTLLLEMPGLEYDSATTSGFSHAPQPRLARKARAVFSFEAVKLSVHTLLKGVAALAAGGEAGPRCRAQENLTGRWLDPAARGRAEAQGKADLANVPLLAAEIRRTLAEAEATCFSTGIRHVIRWITLPPAFYYRESPDLTAQVEARRRVLRQALEADRPHKGACDIGAVEMGLDPSGGGRWSDRSLWSDDMHFLPVLGRQVLRRVLGEASARPAAGAGGA